MLSKMIGNEAPAAQQPLGRKTLIAEIERYLDTVDCFRALGCEPDWRAELSW